MLHEELFRKILKHSQENTIKWKKAQTIWGQEKVLLLLLLSLLLLFPVTITSFKSASDAY